MGPPPPSSSPKPTKSTARSESGVASQPLDIPRPYTPPSFRSTQDVADDHNATTLVPGRPTRAAKPAVQSTAGNEGSDTLTRASVEGGSLTANRENGKVDEIERLREAVNAKLRLSQQRDRLVRQMSSSSPGSPLAKGVPSKVSPIIEETTALHSPTLDAAFSSPTVSGPPTASTESGLTVRDGQTPGVRPGLTTSYPFPPMSWSGISKDPGTPRHKPFTALSPTVAPFSFGGGPNFPEYQDNRVMSGSATPMSTKAFLPPNASDVRSYSDYSSPNLYDITLTLNSEPGLDSWWTNVVEVLRDNYQADRVSLAVPGDSTDPENVPWGQKATFNVIEEDHLSLAYLSPTIQRSDQMEDASEAVLEKMEGIDELLPSSRRASRPNLESRHSFSAFDNRENEAPNESAQVQGARFARPGLGRTISHTAPTAKDPRRVGEFLGAELKSDALREYNTQQRVQQAAQQLADIHNPVARQPRGRVFSVLQPLFFEADPLIDIGGVSRVIERGKMVVLSREYPDASQPGSDNTPGSESEKRKSNLARWGEAPDMRTPKTTSKAGLSSSTDQEEASMATLHLPASSFPSSIGQRIPNRPSEGLRGYPFKGADGPHPTSVQPLLYEEFEQIPASPWSQSPAPSPAVRPDPEENPFFASAKAEEQSFNPSASPQDYTSNPRVEAIGVDTASTIIHIPLIHPLLSKPLHMSGAQTPSDKAHQGAEYSRPGDRFREHPFGMAPEKKIPIAIISVMSPVIPYPSNLYRSLEYLSPHLATSFSQARHMSNLQSEAAGLARRRPHGPSNSLGFGAVIQDSKPLEELANLDQVLLRSSSDEIAGGSNNGSVTSPSEYSGISKSSPPGSAAGTPGWEFSQLGMPTEQRSSGSTPGFPSTSEPVDSYFSAKQRHSLHKSSNGTTSVHVATSPKPTEHIPVPTAAELRASKKESVAKLGTGQTKERHSPQGNGKESPKESSSSGRTSVRNSSPSRGHGEHANSHRKRASGSNTQKGERPHSLLHSYGADFNATYQSLPAATASRPRATVRDKTHSRSNSASSPTDQSNMPPPSERLLRTIIDSIPVQIFTAAPRTGAITWVNSKFLTYRGQTVEQFAKDPWQSIHPEEREEYLRMWSQALGSGQDFSHQVRICRFDGTYRWFYVRAAPLRDTRGITVHWCGTYMDIHEQHVAEVNAARQKETAASEAKYRALANSSPQIVFAATRTAGITFANTQWVSYSGQPYEEALGLGFMAYVHPEDIVKCKLPSFIDSDSKSPDVPISLPARPRRKQSSAPSTEASESTAGSDKTIQPPALKRMNTHSSEFSGMDLPVTELSELARTGILKVSKSSSGKPSYSTEVRLRSREGEYRWHLVRCLAVQSIDPGSSEESWFGTCTDINDHKLLEHKLKETMDSKTRFLSNMSHEIRTPLNGISGMVNFLLDTPLTDEQMDSVNIVRTSCENLGYLINDILDLSKVEAGMVKLSFEPFYVRSVIEEVNDLISALAIKKRLELNYVVDEDVPARVRGDRIRIRQVLLNIIGNAIKFTSEGEVFLHCKVYRNDETTVQEDEVAISFEIEDTGSGFTEQEAELLFKPFSQIDGSSTRQHGGSGLGLVISRQLVELHGGKMRATSVPGRGSTFTFYVKFSMTSPDLQRNDSAESHANVVPSDHGSSAASPSTSLPPVADKNIFSPILAKPLTQSPSPIGQPIDPGHDSPAMQSSGSSDPSIRSFQSLRSERSSASSVFPGLGAAFLENAHPLKLALPPLHERNAPSPPRSATPSGSLPLPPPPMYSVLVVCPLDHSRSATVKHLEQTLPEEIPHQITAQADVEESLTMLAGDDPVVFTHIVLNLRESEDIIAFLDEVIGSPSFSRTSMIITSDSVQKREILRLAPKYDFDRLVKDRRVLFIFKPLKPSKFADIFDPYKVRNLSMDRNRDSAQQVAESQKQIFAKMEDIIGNRGHRILLVEDNEINQKVIQKFFRKLSVEMETVYDGVQCTRKVFDHGHDYYSVIVCDLHMPNKDGYETCREIRGWERQNNYVENDLIPIIALSANVMSDVVDKCVAAGFNDYVAKPVNFMELSRALTNLLDPTKPHELMRHRS
ncbi:MAG: hypothetical protein M1819_000465 [Sarea resinae]|nr:MAG: hypothetical protein M1819_000465 [Sarea resinae]